MLVIRQEQMSALEREARERFERALRSHLTKTYGIPPEQLARELPPMVNAATSYGITRECDIATFCEVIYASGHESGNLPKPALNILLTHGLNSSQKARQMQEWSGTKSTSRALFGSARAGASSVECPLTGKPKPVHWIELALVGEDGAPIPWEEYSVELPSGEVVRGYLDANGFARVDAIENPGECKVTFVDLDRRAWEPA